MSLVKEESLDNFSFAEIHGEADKIKEVLRVIEML